MWDNLLAIMNLPVWWGSLLVLLLLAVVTNVVLRTARKPRSTMDALSGRASWKSFARLVYWALALLVLATIAAGLVATFFGVGPQAAFIVSYVIAVLLFAALLLSGLLG